MRITANLFRARVLIDIEVASGRSFNLKPEQEIALRDLLAGKDVLAVLPTGFGKSLIYQTFLRARDYQLSERAAILVISPMKSIIKDQLDDMERLGYPAVDASTISFEDIRKCSYKCRIGERRVIQGHIKRFKFSLSPQHRCYCGR